MVLTLEKIIEIIEKQPNKKLLDQAKTDHKLLAMHALGIGLDEYILKINSFENEKQYEARKKYGKSNKLIFSILLRPADNVMSARGGSVHHHGLNDNDNNKFSDILQNIENGLSIKKWMDQYWKPAYFIDPMGLIFIEVGEGEAYPSYKNITTILDYDPNGRFLDYVVFEPVDYKPTPDSATVKRYRVVDDAFDYTIDKENGNYSIVEELTYPNLCGIVPAIIASDIPVFDSKGYESMCSKIVECADEYLRDGSVKSVFKFLHAFPKAWEYASACNKCQGTGLLNGNTCPVCNGSKNNNKTDISDKTILSLPEDGSQKIDIPFGYVSPDIEGWKQMTVELSNMLNEMHMGLWGTQQIQSLDNNTATGRFIDVQPVNIRCNKIIDCAESTITFLVNTLGGLYFPSRHKGSSYALGRRLLIESYDTILEKYTKAKKDGAAVIVLNDLLEEYIYTKFDTTNMQLRKELLKMKIEPFPHNSIDEVNSMDISQSEKHKKIYFTAFLNTINDYEYLDQNALIKLNEKFNKFVQQYKLSENGRDNSEGYSNRVGQEESKG